MPQEPLDLCNIEPFGNGDEDNPNQNSVLYNAMIHPLIRLSIKGALWYQGNHLNNLCLLKESLALWIEPRKLSPGEMICISGSDYVLF